MSRPSKSQERSQMTHRRAETEKEIKARQRAERKFQELGYQIIGNLFTIIRSLRLYDIDNDVFVKPLHDLEEAMNFIIAKENNLTIYGSDATVYINHRLIKMDQSSLENLEFLLGEFKKKNLSGFNVSHPVTKGQLRDFLVQFSAEGEEEVKSTVFQGEALKKIKQRIEQMEGEQIQKLEEQRADRHRYAILLYGRLLQYVRRLYDPHRKDPSVAQGRRILQELTDLCVGFPLQFLGFSSEKNYKEYQAYHIANTVLLSLIFGDYLGLGRTQLVDLGMIAIKHELGKMYLDEALLNKTTEPTPEERREIERLPLYTVQRILAGGFDWTKMKEAIIAAGLTLRPTNEPPPPKTKVIQPSGSWLYSRIISLCTCFDALCTPRPFRPKMSPAEALVFMQKRLIQQFDPYLFSRFYHLFRPMVIKAIGKKKMPRQAPPEMRKLKKQLAPPILQQVRAELEEYRALRRLSHRTPEQEHRIAFLRKFLAYKLKMS